MDGVRAGAHGFTDSNSGLHDCGPSDVIMANRKELELSLASPEAYNGLGGIPSSAEGCKILFQLISCDRGICGNQVL